MSSVLTEILNLMAGGITDFATSIGSGLAALVQNVFLTGAGTSSDPYKLSVTGGVIVIFAGISLTIGLSKKVWHFLTSFGK